MSLDTTDKYWSDYYREGRDFISINSQELTQLLAYIPETASKTALDIGCGTGQLTRDLYHSGYKTIGVDVSGEALRTARSLSPVGTDKLYYVHRNVEKKGLTELPFAPYGLITCQSVYAFIQDKKKLLDAVNEVLAPGGIFIIISMLDKNVPSHKKDAALNAENTQATLENHFRVIYYEKADLGYFVCSTK